MIKIILKVFIFMVLCAGVLNAAETPQVELFSPEGTVKDVRQVTVRFTEQMVPFR